MPEILVTILDETIGSSKLTTSNRSNSPTKQGGANSSDPIKRGAKRKVPAMQSNLMEPNVYTTKRPQRVAAQKAIQGISKSLEDTIYVYKDSSESTNQSTKTGQKQNANKKPQSPVLKLISSGSMKKSTAKPRKLWSFEQSQTHQNTDDESNGSPINRRAKNNNDIPLTPLGFRKSVYKNPTLQKSYMLENASRINEDVKRNASESTRATNSTQTTDSSRIKVNVCVCCFWIGYINCAVIMIDFRG